MYQYVKAWHIIFVVTWFAALFYQVRLFIYTREAQDKSETEKNILTPQFLLMAKRLLFGINLPSALLTLILGFWMLYLYSPSFKDLPTWLILKLIFVTLLFGYYVSLHRIYLNQKNGIFNLSSSFLRIWNEVATVFLIVIVFLVVTKDNISWVYAVVSLFGIIMALLIAIRLYKTIRLKK